MNRLLILQIGVAAGFILFVLNWVWFGGAERAREERAAWWNSSIGLETQCAHDFYRVQSQIYGGVDLGCTRSQVKRYFETGGYGFDSVALFLACGVKREEYETKHNINIDCGAGR